MTNPPLPTALPLAATALAIAAPLPAQTFGEGVIITESQILVAATRSANGGAVHTYVRVGSEWRHDGMIVPEGLPEGMIVGQAVVFSGDRVALNAGAPRGGDGRVLVFRHADGDWVQEAVLESPGVEEGTGFGGTLALSDDLLVVGAVAADSLTGAAYVYERGSGGWAMTAELSPAGGGPGSLFGIGALVAGDRILVATGPFDQAGTVTVFSRQGRRMDRNGDSPGL